MPFTVSVQVDMYMEEDKFTIISEGEKKMSELKRVAIRNYGRIDR